MDPNRLTQKSQEALHDAQTKALRFGHTEVDGEHLLQALLDQPEGLAPRLLAAAGGDTGRRLRLRGRGLPNPRGTDGDLFAEVQVMVPAKLSGKERELFEQLAAVSDFDPRKRR